MPEPIHDLDFRRATESDVDAMADAHRDSILRVGSQFYVQAMSRGEVFFIAAGTVGRDPMILGFSSDYVISGDTHGTSAYVRSVAARRGIGSRLLELAESFGRARGASAVQIEASLGAIEFYKRHGFVETARGNVALPSGFEMPCVFMRKELGGPA
jgi:ribosomal protein S18 acetylase RimI-like enzyme